MKPLTLTLLIGGALLVGGALIVPRLAGDGTSQSIPDDALFAVRRGTLTCTITENGSLMAKNSEKISSQAERGGKISFLIEEGKTVPQGEILCKLDTTELETYQQQTELEIVQTTADLDTARTELDIQRSENAANIEKAKIALDKATKELEKYTDGDAPKEQRNFEVAIKEAETNFTKSKKKYEDSKRLLEQEYINKSQVDQDEIDFERAEIELTSARRDLEIFNKYTRPMAMTDKQTAVNDAKRELDNAEKRAQSTLRQKEVAVERAQSTLTARQKNLDEIKKEIGNFTIMAPLPGIVLYGDPSQPWYRNEIKLGSQVWGGFTLFTIPDLRVMQVQLQVHEADINSVKEGQPATITMETYPGVVLKGTVSKIAQVAGDGRGSEMGEVKRFTVHITLDSTEERQFKPGISAKASIFVAERTDALFVPIQCVFLEEGTHYCYVKRDTGDIEKVKVTPDISNDTFTQVVAGLSEGDRVLLYNPQLGSQPANRNDGASGSPASGTSADPGEQASPAAAPATTVPTPAGGTPVASN
ncbi:MAG: efflux RND transporter periplasmic adaptor subunit [Phycisphaerae bacterium]|jgi:HlyD family secretion protein|nr:efflux RND transporter periplasmic adaptor subunit [Phycisphaerae bacterium]